MLQLSKYVPDRFKSWLAPALCLLMVGAVVIIFLFEVSVSKLLLLALAVACPLSHLLFAHGGQGTLDHPSHHHLTSQVVAPALEIETKTPR
jgi:hypothetical protein